MARSVYLAHLRLGRGPDRKPAQAHFARGEPDRAGGRRCFVSWLAKRHKDANIRATAYIFTCATVRHPGAADAETGELAIGLMARNSCSVAGAPAQNAAIHAWPPTRCVAK